MESQKSIPSSALVTICEPPGSSIEELVRQRVIRLAELIRKDGAAYPLTPALVNLWVDVFVRAQIAPERIEGAFDKAEKQRKFWPTPAEVLGFISNAEDHSAEERAAQKWSEVLRYSRQDYHPDLRNHRGRPISDRTRRAIAAAGGLAYLSECTGDDLVFARKRFIEAYLRWDELKQNEFLLPSGEVRNLLAETANAVSVERLLGTPKRIELSPGPVRALEGGFAQR